MNATETKKELLKLSKISPPIRYSPQLVKRLSEEQGETQALINAYFQAHPDEYLREMNEFEELNDDSLPEGRRAFVFVPCFNEEKNLESLVAQYMDQRDLDGKPLDKELFEVCFVVNFPEDENEDVQSSYKRRFVESIDILLKEKERHPNIHIVSKAFESHLGSLGRARKYGMDYCLFRISKHTAGKIDPTIIISNEGDTLEIPQTYVASYLNLFSREPRFVQGKIGYPRELTETYEPVRLFANCREAVHLGQGMLSEEFPFFDGILPVGRNFGVSPSIYVKAGGIDPIRRADTDDDMNFGTDMHVNIGEHVKSFSPIELTTNPRREVMIVRDILAGRQEDALTSYVNFHNNRELYDLSYADILDISRKFIPRTANREEQCRLLNQYFQWVIRSRYKARLHHLPGFADLIEAHRTHQIGYWQKELGLYKIYEKHLSRLKIQEQRALEKSIVREALSWFNYFTSGLNLSFTCTYAGLHSSLKKVEVSVS